MSEESIKLQKVQKSCKVAKTISLVVTILSIVSCVICLITGIVFLANHEKIDADFAQAEAEGKVVQQSDGGIKLNVGPFKVADFDQSDKADAEHVRNQVLTSDIPALESFFEETKDSMAVLYGVYLLVMSVMIAILAVALYMFHRIFAIILEEGNPFSGKVMKRVLISLIFISVVLAFTAGFGFGALGGFLTWVVYTILDYGRTLKTLSDETL